MKKTTAQTLGLLVSLASLAAAASPDVPSDTQFTQTEALDIMALNGPARSDASSGGTAARGGGGPLCEGTMFYQQVPGENAIWTQEDPCAPLVIKLADNFAGNGDPVSGFSWWGVYQHVEGESPQSPQDFVIEIYEYAPFFGGVGQLLHAEMINDYDEQRDPEFEGVTAARFCAYLTSFFPTDPQQEYVVSITPILCSPTQWNWVTSPEGDGQSWVLAPEMGYVDWTPTDVVYGESIDLSFEVFHPQAAIDITKSIPAWLPGYGNATTYTSTLYWLDPRGGCIAPGPSKKITFSLSGVSSELGYAINMGTEDHSDLHLNTPDNGAFDPVGIVTDECDLEGPDHSHWTSVITKDCVTEATVTVVSEDHGSFGWIEASASGCNPIEVVGLLPREPGGGTACALGVPKVKIPRDDDGNDIADAWAGNSTNGNNTPTWDDEDQPNPESRRKGDGLTRYEEYRGAYNRPGAHHRFSTLRKEIAVYQENTAYGAEDLVASADPFYVTADQMNGARHDDQNGTVNTTVLPRVFNFNRTSHTNQDQNGLWLAVNGGDGNLGNWGVALNEWGGRSGFPRTPDDSGRIEVYLNNIAGACALRTRGQFRWGVGRPGVIAAWTSDGTARQDEIIKDLIGHEIGHAHNQQHHTDKRIWVELAPQIVDGWMDLTVAPRHLDRVWTSATGLNTCVMQYKYHFIFQSVALRYRPVQEWYYSVDSNWTPTLPSTDLGYGATCTCRAGTPCRTNAQIRD